MVSASVCAVLSAPPHQKQQHTEQTRSSERGDAGRGCRHRHRHRHHRHHRQRDQLRRHLHHAMRLSPSPTALPARNAPLPLRMARHAHQPATPATTYRDKGRATTAFSATPLCATPTIALAPRTRVKMGPTARSTASMAVPSAGVLGRASARANRNTRERAARQLKAAQRSSISTAVHAKPAPHTRAARVETRHHARAQPTRSRPKVETLGPVRTARTARPRRPAR